GPSADARAGVRIGAAAAALTAAVARPAERAAGLASRSGIAATSEQSVFVRRTAARHRQRHAQRGGHPSASKHAEPPSTSLADFRPPGCDLRWMLPCDIARLAERK